MKRVLPALIVTGISVAALLARGENAAAPAKPVMPPAVNRPVDFVTEVVPIFQQSCVNCHSSGKAESDFSIETREKLIEGGGSGAPGVEPGKSADSTIIQLVSGLDPDPDRFMPRKGKKLTPEQIGVLRAWIDQGAVWPKGYELHDASRPIPAKLEPREIAIPAVHDGITNPIDLLLEPYFAKNKITPSKSIDDRTFARRVYLDLIGLLPPSEDVEKFVNDPDSTKRQVLVRRLMDDKPRYAVHWLSFWNDLLRNDYKGTGYIDGGRLPITPWLYHALLDDMPYDRFVRELVTGANGSEGFTKGIVWRGVVNAAQTPQMQAAQNIGQVFMGVNLKCASCHDSFISQWKLTDSYGLAGVYADKPLEMERCSKPLGQTASMKFLYPQLGSIDAKAPREQRLQQLAQIITNQRNGRLSRTLVNRLWQRLMGRAIVEPVDEMDNPPWNGDLLDALAWKFAHDDHFDVKKTLETIVLSRAYQMPAAPIAENAKEYVFRGPCFKKMTAEQFADAVASVTGIHPAKQDAALSTVEQRYRSAKWIWSVKDAEKSAPPGKIYLRRAIPRVDPDIVSAVAVIACDNAFVLKVNGKEVARGDDWHKPVTVDVAKALLPGRDNNVISVVATNTLDTPNPAGFWFSLNVSYAQTDENHRPVRVNSDASWKVATKPPADDAWTTDATLDEKWPAAKVVGDIFAQPWALKDKLPGDDPVDRPAEIRAALCAADPLTTALGRPNREQVLTVRPSASTTLMALELTNGATLTEILSKGARKLAVEPDLRAEELIDRVYQTAFSRPPTAGEVAAAKELTGAELKEDGVEDFLWAVVMLPEFQIIR